MTDLDPGPPLLVFLSEQAHVLIIAAAVFVAFVGGAIAWKWWRKDSLPDLERALHRAMKRKEQDR